MREGGRCAYHKVVEKMGKCLWTLSEQPSQAEVNPEPVRKGVDAVFLPSLA